VVNRAVGKIQKIVVWVVVFCVTKVDGYYE